MQLFSVTPKKSELSNHYSKEDLKRGFLIQTLNLKRVI